MHAAASSSPLQELVQCDRCEKWRKLPLGETSETLGLKETWYCGLEEGWNQNLTCEVPEEQLYEPGSLEAMRYDSLRAVRELKGFRIEIYEPIRLSLHQPSSRRFKCDTERVQAILTPTVVTLRSAPSGNAFEWAYNQFYAVAAENCASQVCIVDGKLSVRYEIWDISEGEAEASLLFATSTKQTWQRKYFWFSAVNFLIPGTFLLRFSPSVD